MVNALSSSPPPPPPGGTGPPPPRTEQVVETIEEQLESGELDLETLSARLTERFGEDGAALISDDGEVDFSGLATLMDEQRAERRMAHLTEHLGEDIVGQFTLDDGSLDFEGLKSYAEENGLDMPPPPRSGGERPNGASGFGDRSQSGALVDVLI